jgi:hypothetical protein
LYTPSYAATIYVHAGDNLQTAINNAQPGDTLILDAGVTFTGPITLPAKNGSSYITIRSSALAQLPAASTRVSPSDSPQMPRIVSPGPGNVALKTASGASYYSFIGVEFATANPNHTVDTLITLGDGANSSQSSFDQIPHHLTFDRCYIHGSPTQDLKRGIGLNSRETSILNSYISGFKSVGYDSQAIAGWNGPGPFHIINNYLEGAGENIMFGGADANNSNNQPSDIEIRRNLISKPLSWRVGDPSYAGTQWQVKNLLELKNAQRVTIEGNILENCWAAAQGGTAVLLTPRNQNGTNPWANINNVVFRNNIIRHAVSAIGTLSTDDGHSSQVLHDLTVSNNLLYDINGGVWGDSGGGVFIGFNNTGAYNLMVQHNTAYTNGTGYFFEANTQVSGLVIKDNISHAHYLWNGSAGTNALNGAAPNGGWTAQRNVIVLEGYDGSVSYWQNYYPLAPNTYLTATWSAVGFADVSNGNYRLATTSPYKGQATDGKDIGCDIDALNAAMSSQTQAGFSGGFSDDFSGATRDATKWNLGVTTISATSVDPTVSVSQQNGQLSVTPKPYVTGLHYNGYTTAASYNFNGGITSAQVVQMTNDYRASAFLSMGIDGNNYCRIGAKRHGTDYRLSMSYRVNGGAESTTSIYNLPAIPKYLRLRHLVTGDSLVWESSDDGTTWTIRRQEVRGFALSSVHVDLYSGSDQYLDPITAAVFDDFLLQGQSSEKRFVFDSFTGTGGTELSTRTGEIGATWINGTNEPYAGSMYISNVNRLRWYDRSVYYASGTPTSAEYDVQADFVLVGGTPGSAGLVGRFEPTTGYFYRVFWEPGSNSLILQKSTATTGGSVFLGSYTPGTPAVGSTHTIKLEIRNAAKKVYYDGVLVISSTDNELIGAGRAGIWVGTTTSNTSGWNIDNFSASNP